MAFDKEKRDQIWTNTFGQNNDKGTDIFGREVYKSKFDADHILPEAEGGSDKVENGLAMHPKSNEEKADDLSGTVNGKRFQVIEVTDGVGKLKVD